MSQAIIDLLKRGTEANKADKFRRGNLICLPAGIRLIVTGDLHGHRRNFERIVSFADLDNNPDTHIILQEIIHGGPEDPQGGCISYQLLFDVVGYKLKFPDRIHIVMGNHDTAFISDLEVLKEGREMNRSMRLALKRQFDKDSTDIELAIKQLLLSQPLALKTENRIWVSHSLPGNRYADKFDRQILDRELNFEDCQKPGPAYLLTWGRDHSQQTLDKMAELFEVDIFILGHQPQTQGWGRAGENLIIIASDHNHGCLLPIDTAKSYTIAELLDLIVPLASIS
jgi:hypothetical protein